MSFLEEILTSTRDRVEQAKTEVPAGDVRRRAERLGAPRDLRAALANKEMSLIGEVKRATPALGKIAPDLRVEPAARAYARGGAAAVSVLTEPEWFWGSLADVSEAAQAGLPVLQKDFLIDPYQVYEGRGAGADSVLVIVRIAPGSLLMELVDATRSLGMTPLVEVFDSEDMERAAQAGADVIGINHRDLASFTVDANRTAELAPQAPEGAVVVSLSGVRERKDVEAMAVAGAGAVLVGEALVTSSDPAAKVAELLGR